MLLLRRAPLRWDRPGLGWQSPVTIPRLWLAAIFAACALFAAGLGVFSTDSLHRLWGLFAAIAYVLAAVVVLAWRSSRAVDLALLLGVGGALVAPLSLLAEQGRWQPEVGVIARGARLLVQHGSPYESQAVVSASHDPNIYNPYLPVMAIFGLPRALFGPGLITDPRIWFTLGFVALFAAALAVAGARDVLRWTLLVTATPVIAFSLAVGGTDVPVLALLCLGPGAALAPPPAAAGRPGAGHRRGHQGDRVARPARGRDHAAGAGRQARRGAVPAGRCRRGGRHHRAGGRGVAARPGGEHHSLPARAGQASGRRRPARCPGTCWPTPGRPGTRSPSSCSAWRARRAALPGGPPAAERAVRRPGGSSSAWCSCSCWPRRPGSVTSCTRWACGPGWSCHSWARGACGRRAVPTRTPRGAGLPHGGVAQPSAA